MATGSIYTEGGAVQAGDGIYLTRAADERLLQLCREGSYAYVLTSRQMGKTSLMENTAFRLRENHTATAVVDLSAIGVNVDASAWFLGFLTIVEEALEPTTDVFSFWERYSHLSAVQRFSLFFEEVLLVELQQPIVIFVDEVDTTLNLDFTDDFFAAVRAFFNKRAHQENLKRLTFILLGTASPTELIADPVRTPFNIGEEVILDDFGLEEALPLCHGLGLPDSESRSALARILYWSGGHPSLTQRLCILFSQETDRTSPEATVDRVVHTWFLGTRTWQDNNLQFVRGMLTRGGEEERRAVLNLYRRILRSPIRHDSRSLIQLRLKLAGIVRKNVDRLEVRNRIYAGVFNKKWLSENTPIHWPTRLYRTGIGVVASTVALALIVLMLYTRNLRESRAREAALRQDAEQAATVAQQEAVRARQSEEKALQSESQVRHLNQELASALEKQERLRLTAELEKERTQAALIEESRALTLAELEAEAVKLLADNRRGEAAETLKAVYRLHKEKGAEEAQVETLERISRIYDGAGDHEAAITWLRQALTMREQGVADKAIPATLLSLAEMHHTLGRYREAADLFARGREAMREEDPVLKVNFLAGEGLARRNSGEYERARDLLGKALSLAQRIHLPPREAELHLMMATLNERTSANGAAVESALKALEIYQDLNQRDGQAQALTQLGRTVFSGGAFDEALNYLERALNLHIRLGNRLGEKETLGYLFLVRDELGQSEQASQLRDPFLVIPNPQVKAEHAHLAAHLAQVLQRMGLARESEKLLLPSMGFAARSGDKALESHCLAGLAQVDMEAGLYEKALQRIQEKIAIDRQLGAASPEVEGHLLAAKCYQNLAQADRAGAHLQQAFDLTREVHEPLLEIRAATELARHLGDQGQSKRQAAQSAYAHAITVLERQLREAPLDISASLAARYGDVYSGTIRIHMAQHEHGVAFSLAERGRTVTELGQYKPRVARLLGQWQSYSHGPKPDLLLNVIKRANNYAPRDQRLSTTVSSLQERLDNKTTIVSYMVMEQEVLAFVVTADEFHALTLPFDGDYLYEVVEVPSAYYPLYNRLIAPIRHLIHTPRVGVVPHDMLLAMPEVSLKDWSRWLAAETGRDVRFFAIPSVVSPVLSPEEMPGDHLPPSLADDPSQ